MRNRTDRVTGDGLWIPTGMSRGPATAAIALLSAVALVAVFFTGTRLTVTMSRAVDAGVASQTAYGTQGAAGADKLGELDPQCDGDGTSGNRIEFYYAYYAGQKNRIGTVRQNLIRLIEQANYIVYRSAQMYGADESLRVVTDRNCVPIVHAVELPVADEVSFHASVRDSHLSAPNRKYVLFTDATYYCGLGTLDYDDRPGPDNRNNRGPSWARVDLGCWSGSVTAHEIFHMLGAVQPSAPHYDGTGHCTDEYDLMCYQSPTGKTVTVNCPDPVMQDRLDCNGDDYYNPNPPAGSYLATHWNTADSSFLYGSGGGPST